MNFVLNGSQGLNKLYPITEVTPILQVFAGIFTIQQRWEKYLDCSIESIDALPEYSHSLAATTLIINPFILPSVALANAIKKLPTGTRLVSQNIVIAEWAADYNKKASDTVCKEFTEAVVHIDSLWTLISHNNELLKQDVNMAMKSGLPQQNNAADLQVIGDASAVFFGKNVTCLAASLNTTSGPIVISDDAVIMEGSYLRGPLFIGPGTVVKMGAKIYGGSFQGNCTLGGEIKNVVMLEGSNKAHDGYLGDSYVGGWCNFGAGATVSNVKNTAAEVQAYHYAEKAQKPVGNKAGMLMGNFCRVAINSSINTGTVFGTCVNYFSQDLSPSFVPSFSWGNERYLFEKAIEHTNNWMKFKQRELPQEIIDQLYKIYHLK